MLNGTEMRPVTEGNTELTYLYDGTFEGFLCCIYDSYVHKEVPTRIDTEDGMPMLFEATKWIKTDWNHAQSIYASLAKKIGMEAQEFLRDAFLSNAPNKEIYMYHYICMGYKLGRKIFDYLTDPTVGYLVKAVKNVNRECQKYLGFIRFTQYGDVMVACITPKNRVLPRLASHFENRFPDSSFLIYDKTHKMAVVKRPEGMVITSMEKLTLPTISDEEQAYRRLWKCFLKNIAIEERTNPKCQMNLMPKRYWKDMDEDMLSEYKDGDLLRKIEGNA